MIPIIDKKKTGIHLRKIMDARELSVKDVQQYANIMKWCTYFFIQECVFQSSVV